jgi:sterol desaturase/sphingolipid hydroxylase (fatty acid hydroxylase superfamily)
MGIDKPLLFLALLLALVLAAYLLGWIPWPFGILIILILLVARVSHLQSRKFRKGGRE